MARAIPCAFDSLVRVSVPHILEKIFLSLDYKSFKSCKKVSISWNELLTSESFKRMGKAIFQEDIEWELRQASLNGNSKEVSSILSSDMVDVNCIGGPYDATPLHHASKQGHKGVVQLLLDEGAELKKADIDGKTPIHLATYNGHRDVVQLLLDRGAEPNQAMPNGTTPLHLAAHYGHKDVVQLLLDRGAEPNQAMPNGWTPLHRAAHYGHKDVVHVLLIGGADPNNVTVNGNTPQSIAFNRGHTDIVNMLQGGGA